MKNYQLYIPVACRAKQKKMTRIIEKNLRIVKSHLSISRLNGFFVILKNAKKQTRPALLNLRAGRIYVEHSISSIRGGEPRTQGKV